jgi:hypothetical protein
VFLLTLGGVALAGYWVWLKLEQASIMIAGPAVIVTVIGGAVAAFVVQVRSMSPSDILDLAVEGVLAVYAAIGAVLRGIWNWFLGLLGLD